jgi:hypothetical protein
LCIVTDFSKVNVEIPLRGQHIPNVIALEANDYTEKSNDCVLLKPYGKYVAGAKALSKTDETPYISYNFSVEIAREYEMLLYLAPSNPINEKNELKLGLKLNDSEIKYIDTISKDYRAGESSCTQWAQGVLDNIRIIPVRIETRKGINKITIFLDDYPIVLERIVLRDTNTQLKLGYIGILPQL